VRRASPSCDSIYFLNDISGCCINPAVNLAFLVAGDMSLKKFLGFTAVQAVGATLATLLVAQF
jgi:glycerol uptake facilitator-like aquaporin